MKSCTCYALRAVDCTCLPAKYDEIYEIYTTPEQEPVATKNNDGVTLHLGWDDLPVGTKLYAAPPQRTWVGLTDEEVTWLCNTAKSHEQTWGMFVRAIEAKLKEKNT